MEDQSRPRRRRTRVLAVCLLALVMSELAIAIVTALARTISWADAVGSFTVTNGAMGLGFAGCGVLLASMFLFGWPLAIGLCLPVTLLLFPDGRPAGPRWRWLIWAAGAEGLLFVLAAAGPGAQEFGGHRVSPFLTVPFYRHLVTLWTAGNIAYPLILALAITSLAVRYRRGGDAMRRQLLWLVLACLVVFAYAGLLWGLIGTGPILGLLVVPLIPAAVTVAILRYQLLDIRLVFSRTLAYAIVTGVLAGVYAGLVLLTTQAVPFSAPVAVATSTLTCAAMFAPLRRRTQRIVDRRFNQARYDADQAIAGFTARLQDSVDLGAVSADLTATVQAALEPAHLSVWISHRPS